MLIAVDHEDGLRRNQTAAARANLADVILGKLAGRELLECSHGLRLFQCSEPMRGHCGYVASLAMIVRGKKRVLMGDTTYLYDESRFLLTALDVPVLAEVLEASPEAPFVSLTIELDCELAKQVIAEIDVQDSRLTAAAIATGPATPELFDAAARWIALLDSPRDLPVLGKLIQREILYRVLTGPTGPRLRQTVRMATEAQPAARALAWLRANYKQPLRIEELAEQVHMGVSTLHHHFRAIASMSPLQFQKQLRLHEARRLMLFENMDAGSAAFHVGYESATQFNREYRRLFGAPPLRDVKALRRASTA